MSKTGQINLHDSSDQFVRGIKYKSKNQREAILTMWAGLYQQAFEGCYIHIIPDLKPEPEETEAHSFGPDA